MDLEDFFQVIYWTIFHSSRADVSIILGFRILCRLSSFGCIIICNISDTTSSIIAGTPITCQRLILGHPKMIIMVICRPGPRFEQNNNKNRIRLKWWRNDDENFACTPQNSKTRKKTGKTRSNSKEKIVLLDGVAFKTLKFVYKFLHRKKTICLISPSS